MDAPRRSARHRARGIGAVAALGGFSALAFAGCVWISEGCTYPPEQGASAAIPFTLDAEHPVVATSIEVALTADALPGKVDDRGARIQLTLDHAQDVALTFVPAETGVPVPLIVSQGKVSLPLVQCQADEPCSVRAQVIMEWTDPRPDAPFESRLTVEGLARVPHTTDQCGFRGGDPVTVTSTPPAPRSASARSAVGDARHDGTELVRHVTVAFDGDGAPPASGDEPAVATGHLALTPDPDPEQPGTVGTFVPGLWLRVTPDGGGPAVLDGPVPISYPPLPASATFPIDAPCARPCERGYWIQAAVYDPAGRTVPVPAAAVYGWAFDAGVSTASPPGSTTETVDVTLDEPAGRPLPAPLVLRGTGAPFRVDASHPMTTLAIDASAPARSPAPYEDTIAQVPVEFQVTTVAIPGAPFGQLWLSNGHYIGDGSTGDDAADTGATGGPTTRSTPAGRPFAACAASTDPCSARTGLVLHQYDGDFDNGTDTPPFDVRWDWTVVGAPVGATITVQALEGETLDARGIDAVNWPLVGAVVAGGSLAILLVVLATRRATRRRRTPTPGG